MSGQPVEPREQAVTPTTRRTASDRTFCIVANAVKGVVLGAVLAYGGGQVAELAGVADRAAPRLAWGVVLGLAIGLAFGVLRWIGAGWWAGLSEGLVWVPAGACVVALIFVAPVLLKPATIWATGGWQAGLASAFGGAIVGGIAGAIIGSVRAKDFAEK
jgi:hypothetical protein